MDVAAMLSNSLCRTDVFIFRWVSLQPYLHQLPGREAALPPEALETGRGLGLHGGQYSFHTIANLSI